jgi:hypothetical protein
MSSPVLEAVDVVDLPLTQIGRQSTPSRTPRCCLPMSHHGFHKSPGPDQSMYLLLFA